ncbi:MAG: hypothetical protein PUD81_00245 [Eggerthellales bacterium]|nr:hypothetical protein [Eggerthellales bacterium]
MRNASKYPQIGSVAPRAKGLGALLALLALILSLLCVPSTQALAEDSILYSEEYSHYGVPYTTMSKVRSEPVVDRLFSSSAAIQRGDVFVVVAPGWEWDDIKEETTPTLYNFVYANASANLVYNAALNWDDHAQMDNFHMMAFKHVSTSEMEEIMVRVVNNLKTGDSLVITNSVAFIGEYDANEDYSCFVMKDASDKGLLTSDVTRHMGLISTWDAINAIDALAASSQRFPGNLTVYPATELMPTITRLDILTRDSHMATALQASQPRFIVFVVGCLLLAMLLTVVLLFLEIRIRPAVLAYLLPAARIMWIVSLAMPLASYLMMLQLPIHCDPEICLDYFWFTALEVSLVCMIVALVFRWSWAYMALLGATVITLVADQLVGGPLSIGSYLSYAPVEGVRFFGIGNEGAALLYGAWVMLVAFYLTRRPFTKLAQRLRRWLFPMASLLIMMVIAAPWWGANFGCIIWGTVGTFVAWRLFGGHRFSKREVLAAVLVSGLMAVAVLFLDTTFNSGSHMGGSVDFSKGGIIEQVIQVFVNVAKFCWDTLVFSPVLTVVFFCIVAFLLFIVVKKPGPYREFWASHVEFQGAFYALIVTALLMFTFEDSGILMPALMLLYPLSGLMWFVCNFHSWHIRAFIKERRVLER